MRKVLLIGIFSFLCLFLSAQGLNYGVTAGMTSATIIEKSTILSPVQKSVKFGYRIGIAGEFELLETVFVSSSLSFMTKGDKYKDRFAVSKASFGCFELPVYIGYKVPLGNFYLSGNVGPYSSLAIVGRRTYTPEPEVELPFEWNFEETAHEEYVDNTTAFYGEQWNSYKRFDTGVSFGLRAGYKNYHLLATYSRSFIDVRPNETVKATHSVFSISFIYYAFI